MHEHDRREPRPSPELELEAESMKQVVRALDVLSHMARRRVLRWAWMRYIAQEPLDEQ
jgi:hypothetical protein